MTIVNYDTPPYTILQFGSMLIFLYLSRFVPSKSIHVRVATAYRVVMLSTENYLSLSLHYPKYRPHYVQVLPMTKQLLYDMFFVQHSFLVTGFANQNEDVFRPILLGFAFLQW